MVVVFALFGGDPGEVAFVVVVVSGVAQLVFRRVFEDHAGGSLQVVDGDVLLTAPGVFDGLGGEPAVVDVAEGPFAGDDHGDEPVVFVVDVTVGFAFGAGVAVFQAVGPVAVAGGFFEVAGVDADAGQLVEVVVAAGLAQSLDVGGGVVAVAVAPRGLAVAAVLVVVVVVVVDHFHRVGGGFVAIQCCPDQPVGGIVVVFCFFFSGVDDSAPVAVGIVVVAALCGAGSGLFDFCLQAVVFVVMVAGLPPLWILDLQQVVAVVVTVGGFALVGVYAADQAHVVAAEPVEVVVDRVQSDNAAGVSAFVAVCFPGGSLFFGTGVVFCEGFPGADPQAVPAPVPLPAFAVPAPVDPDMASEHFDPQVFVVFEVVAGAVVGLGVVAGDAAHRQCRRTRRQGEECAGGQQSGQCSG